MSLITPSSIQHTAPFYKHKHKLRVITPYITLAPNNYMKATVITIGDEILIGQIVDTNSAWIGQKFSELGVKIHEIISCGDDAGQIVSALDRAKANSQVVLMTGGLGPTKDD